MYTLPILSGIFLALVFYPFYFWPLAFVALVPFYYFVAGGERTLREVFWGGCITGLIVAIPLVYFSLALLRILPDAVAFSYAIRASSVLAAALVAVSFGGMALAYKMIRTRSSLLNALIGASLYSIFELVQFFIYSGYYLGSLAHAVVPLSLALVFAAVAGAPLVSFLVVWINCSLAEILAAPSGRRTNLLGSFALIIMVGVLCASQVRPQEIQREGALSISLIQAGLEPPVYEKEERGVFSNPVLGELLASAASESDLVVYPFSPVQGAIYRGEPEAPEGLSLQVSGLAVGEWLRNIIPPTTTILMWITFVEGGEVFDEYALWRNGEKSEYRKQVLHPFSDYVPTWAQGLGLRAFPYTTKAGDRAERPHLGELEVGGLICSELHQSSFVRQEATQTPLFIAVGSDTIFPGDLAGNFSLAAARLRAAENGVTIVRGNLQGPSAVIGPDGSIEALLAYGERGILRTMVIPQRIRTLYSHTGSALVYGVAALTVLLGVFFRTRPDIKFLGRRVSD